MSITLPPLPGDWECGRFFDPEELRARDLEVAKVVLEAAAKVCDAVAEDADSAKRKPLLTANGVLLYEGQWGGASNCGSGIRALEVSHAE